MAKFAADAMLKKLARWLRIFGADTEFLDIPDNEILAFLSAHPGRILLTQDVQLHERAKRRKLSSFLVPRNVSTEEQVASIFKEFGLSLGDFEARTICPRCNSRLIVVGSTKAEGKAPPAVLARHSKFWLCENCGKAYWEGTHWEKISSSAKRVNSILSPK